MRFIGRRKGSKSALSSGVRVRPTPIWISKRTRNVLALAVIVLVGLVMWVVPAAPVALVGGFALALVLSFPVQALSHVMPRGLAIVVSFLAVIGLVLLALLILIPILLIQLGNLIGALPGFVAGAKHYGLVALGALNDAGLLPASPKEIVSTVQDYVSEGATAISKSAVGGAFGYLTRTVSLALSVFGILFVSAYFLADVRDLKAAFLLAAPKHYRRDARDLWNAFGFSLSRYLSGLALVTAIQGVLSAVALYFIGVPYALVLGAWVSLTALIPLLGAWLGAVPAVIVAFTVSPGKGVLTMLLFLAIQQLEGNFLTPRIHGQVLHVHPILVFLAVIIGGGLGGIVGVLLAVPALAVIRVLFDFLRLRLRTRPQGASAAVGPSRRPPR